METRSTKQVNITHNRHANSLSDACTVGTRKPRIQPRPEAGGEGDGKRFRGGKADAGKKRRERETGKTAKLSR